VWEVATGKPILLLEPDTPIGMVAFSPNGSRLLVAPRNRWYGHRSEGDTTLQAWDLITGKEVRSSTGHLDVVNAAMFSPDGKAVASASADGTVLVWDVAAFEHPRRGGLRASPRGVEDLWTDLGSADAAAAYRAAWGLTAAPEQVMPMLARHLRPVPHVDPRQLEALVADLGARQFAVRQKAMEALDKLGDLAEPLLRKALASEPPLEVRRRVERLLDKLDGEPSSSELRLLRAVTVLERTGTPPAHRLLQTLADGAPGARLTVEAQGAVRRLGLRGVSGSAAIVPLATPGEAR
jgi:hypothetical protein